MRGLGLVILCLFFGLIGASRLDGTSKQTLQVQKRLKHLNKPAIKSIESPDGDIIDCVDISKQPAFDHPYLKGHKIQMRPNFHPEGLFDENKVETKAKERANPINQMWHANGKCPENTIPIRRTKEKDVLRASSVKRYGRKKHRTIPKPRAANLNLIDANDHEHALVYVRGDKYYGAKATINLWNPKVQQPNEFSLSQLWILGGPFGEGLNTIEAGWQVCPSLYGDNNTRLFIYWTRDGYRSTGCYNLKCPGFIQTNQNIAVGASMSPISSYGSSQYDITILIWKDPKEGNWWMKLGNNDILGYWPSSLFSYLRDSASMVEWGGEVVNSKPDGQHTSTPMGSGHFPKEGFGKASYFKNIQVVDSFNSLKAPNGIGTLAQRPNCYDVQTRESGNWGQYFYYGGPGRNPNCP